MNEFWTTEKVASTLQLPLLHSSAPSIGITTDSRQVKPGSIFVAIKGDQHDGHHFIPSAIASGAVAIISEIEGTHPSGEFFHVPSTLKAIRSLAKVYRNSFSIPFIGIVGAVGKTTTKELIASLLKGRYSSIHKTEGSQNGYLGIPITLLELKPTTDIAVIEIGIDDIGAMEEHLDLVNPTHTLLTKIGPEHLHQLKTVDIAAEEELKALDRAAALNTPMCINLSDPYVSKWFQKNIFNLTAIKAKTYSLNTFDAPNYLGTYSNQNSELTIQADGFNASFSLPLPGEHHAQNLLAAIVMCHFFNLTPSELKAGLATFKTAFGRTETYILQSGTHIIGDYYNSNPTSLEAALKLLNEKRETRNTYAILGDMLELGDGEEKFHRDIAAHILEEKVTGVLLFGNRMKWLLQELNQRGFKAVQHFESHEALLAALRPILNAQTHLLIKGSRGMRMEKILQALLPKSAEATAH